MVSLQERHAKARAGIELLESMGIDPRDVGPYTYQRFLRNDFSVSDLPIYRVYDVSFQLNYDQPKDKKNNKFKLETAKTYKVKTGINVDESRLKEGVIESINDWFGHKSLTKDLDLQGIEERGFVLDWDLDLGMSDFIVEDNDDVKFDLQFMKGSKGSETKLGRKYSDKIDLINFL